MKSIIHNIALYILSLLPVMILVITSNNLGINFFSIMVIIYLILLCIPKSQKNQGNYTIGVRWIKVYAAYLIDIMILITILLFISRLYDNQILKSSSRLNVYLGLFLLIENQIFFRSIGFRIFRIYIPNDTTMEKFKIIILNIFICSPIYFLILGMQFPMIESSMDLISEFLIMLCFFNISSRIWIFKTQSALEKLLNVHIYQKGKLNNETEKKD